ncbi:hypothetical protein B296_00041745 [Ensete ventricosum]|uniref:Uncharacterized protein n=1 Tax=Ensete ventricosum TaxID=4639 RepID=A0A426Y7S1_ENSVE|nr:hypothetical protein B296_00041745 [Ensete ventricosum]
MTTKSRRTIASIGDGGPEDAPEELTSGSHRLVSPDPGEKKTLTLLEESEEVIPTCSKKSYRLKGRWVTRKVRGQSAATPKAAQRIKCAITPTETLS